MKNDARYRMFLMLLGWLVLPFIFFGCSDEESSPIDNEPFVRLLENQKMQSVILNGPIEYAVLLPVGYNESEEEYPVVYLLHGYGDDETAWYKGGSIQYFVDKYSSEITPMIYVMPQGFNRYYIDKYNGRFSYMQMFVNELVPTIDERYRTKAHKTQRAVMGYSMGGYGALILPAMNPEVFSIGIPLSMSFRTDEQYRAESQSSFDNQWAPNFGPYLGASGEERLSDYFKAHSPFHFFNQEDVSMYNDLKFLMDCGDDEETLSNTNDDLHALMRDKQIAHEYRVRSGGHSFDYWKKSYPEALKFISNAVQGIEHPSEPAPVDLGTLIGENDFEQLEVSGITLNILKPIDYDESIEEYAVLYLIHDAEGGDRTERVIDVFSLLRNAMTSSTLAKSIVVEIPDSENLNSDLMQEILNHVDTEFRTKENGVDRVLMANAQGGIRAITMLNSNPDGFGSCFLICAALPEGSIETNAGIFYYLDITDDCGGYNGYNKLYSQIRSGEIEYEYRVRQGGESFQSFLNGLGESLVSLKQSLKN